MMRHKKTVFDAVADWDPPNRFTVLIRTTLYFCLYSSSRKYIATFLFIILSIFIGTLTVYLTSRKPDNICQHIHRRTVTNIRKYTSRPRFAAIDHFNNDSLLDFVVVNTALNSIDIYLGQNNGTFMYHTTYSTGSRSQPCSVAGGNLDNHPGIDIAVANFDTNNIVIFMGSNNGFFTFNQSISTGSSRPLMIALADLNDDHWLDLAVLNYGTDSVGIYISSRNGLFVFSTNYPTGYDSLPKSLAIADLNNDNHVDIVVANSGTNNVGIFSGNGNGTFADQKIYSTGVGSNPSSIAVGDIDHDDHMDIIVANNGINNVTIFYGDMDGDSTKKATYSTGSNSHPECVAVYDFNRDHHLDIIAIDSINERVYVLPGNQNGTFPLLSTYITDFGSYPIFMAGTDFDNDNRSDILIVNWGADNILILMEYDIHFSASYNTFTSDTLSEPRMIAIGDLNGDNTLDMAVISDENDIINIFLGHGNGSFRLVTSISIGLDVRMNQIILDDINNDQQLDVLVLAPNTNSFRILLGHGNGLFSSTTTFSTNSILSPFTFAAGDIDNDNCLDIVMTGYTSDNIGIFLGNCNGFFEMSPIYKLQTNWSPDHIILDDFNNDNKLDLLVISYLNGHFNIYLGDGTGRLSLFQNYSTEYQHTCTYMVSADLNNDNQTDLVSASGMRNQITIFHGYGNGSFINERTYSTESCLYPIYITFGDFNSDHQTDLAVSCFNTRNVVILLGIGNGELRSPTTYSTGLNSNPFCLVSGDFNNDEMWDIAVADPSGNKIGMLMSYYKADFAVQKEYSTGSSPQPYSVAVADFNKDNISDLVVVNSGTKNIVVRLGIGDGSFESETLYPIGPNSFPEYVDVGDLNGDDHVDIVVADSKSNVIIIFLGIGNGTFANNLTFSMGLQSSPTSVVITNLNNDKWVDLVVANQGSSNLGILYGYNYAAFILHQIYFTGNGSDPYAVSVGDLNNDNRLDIVVANFDSRSIGIFFGDGNGSSINQMIYSTAPTLYPVAVIVADMNKDGSLDIVVGGIGRRSIGIILGNAAGTFQTMIGYSIVSNTYIPAMVVDDINNDDQLDLIVTDYAVGSVIVFLGLGNGSLSLMAIYSTGAGSKPVSIDVGDFNNDNCLDIVFTDIGLDVVGTLKGYGNGNFAPPIIHQLKKFSSPFSVALGDFNKDKQLDIAASNFALDCVEIFHGFGNGSFAKPEQFSTGVSPTNIIVDYFNDDSRLDIAVVCARESAFVILFGTDTDNFLMGRKFPIVANSPYKLMASGDFNNDSHQDLVILNTLDAIVSIFLWKENEPFGTPFTSGTGFGSKPHSLAVGDFDHDNRSDIVVANSGTDNIAIILATQLDSGTDLAIYSTGSGSLPHGLVVGDFNDDDQLDIAVVNFGLNSVTIFRGYGDGSFLAIGSYSTGSGSIPRSIAMADFNNDQKLDLVIANTGANNVLILFGFGNGTFGNKTSYSMKYDSRPYSVAVGDFDRDGWMDMAVANFGADYVEILLQPC